MSQLNNIEIPKYTKGEELANTISHGIGGIIGIVATIMCTLLATKNKDVYAIVSGLIFGISMIILYIMSSTYHGLNPKFKAKKIFRILDHCAIYLLIAGSYTPILLCVLREYSSDICWTIWGVIWCLAIIGIIVNAIDLKKYKIFSMICYLIMGWCIIFTGRVLPELLGTKGFALLLSGGIAYTIGAILYGLGKKHKYMHFVFHLFVLIGNFLHFLCIYLYVM